MENQPNLGTFFTLGKLVHFNSILIDVEIFETTSHLPTLSSERLISLVEAPELGLVRISDYCRICCPVSYVGCWEWIR